MYKGGRPLRGCRFHFLRAAKRHVDRAWRPEKRNGGNGYAHAVVTALCQEHFREGRQSVCLFWDNPDAWRMYQRMGFVPVGPFTMAYPLPQ
ncbi:MAG: hypothetical protein LKE39_01655 [Sphaerochaeta sp.]|nr:hypothetical protein [Sphaerochaeta sp.]